MTVNYNPRTVTDGLILSFDAANRKSYPGTGTTWFDLCDGRNNTTLVSGPSFNSSNGGSIVFDGINDVANATTSLINRTTGQEITVSCWIRPSRTSGQYSVFCTNRSNDTGTFNWIFYQHTSDGAISFHGGSTQNKSLYVPTTNAWINVTNTVTSAGVSTLYINGVSAFVKTGYTYGASPSRLGIGANPGAQEPFQGNISLVSIYDRALTAAEVQQNFNALKSRFIGSIGPTPTPVTDGLVTSSLVINLDGGELGSYPGSGSTWTDISGNGRNGTLVNGVGYNSSNGGALVFDGSNDYITLGTFFNYTNFTISLFVYPGSTQVQYADIFDNNHTGVQNFVCQQDNLNTNQYQFGCLNATNASVTSVFTLTANTWQYLTFTWNNSVASVYINGVFHSSGSAANPINYSSPNLRLGGWNLGGRNWNGRMGNFIAYNRVLTQAEITQNFNALRGRFGI